jgi:hypothetical protein
MPVSAGLRSLWLIAAIFAAASVQAAVTPVVLYLGDDVASVWDTDPSKIGIELQIGNSGNATADDVRVTAITVQGGALRETTPLPILLRTIRSKSSVLLNFVIAVPPSKYTRYRLTIAGTYIDHGTVREFSLSRTISPDAAAPDPAVTHRGASGKSFNHPAGSDPPAPAAGRPPFAPNATTPMMIPVGPPRQLSLPAPTPNR